MTFKPACLRNVRRQTARTFLTFSYSFLVNHCKINALSTAAKFVSLVFWGLLILMPLEPKSSRDAHKIVSQYARYYVRQQNWYHVQNAILTRSS